MSRRAQHTTNLKLILRFKVKERDCGVIGLRIGELAGVVGVRPSTIRFYERAGLLPEAPRTPAGYRQYDQTSFDRMTFIHAGQAIGLTLGELREIIKLREQGTAPCDHVLGLIERHLAAIAERVAELQQLRGDLTRLAARARSLDPAQCGDSDICQVVIDPAKLAAPL